MKLPVIVIFDVGKTNKKVLVFDEQYKLVQEQSAQLEETTDEDGFPCEDVHVLTKWVQQKFTEILSRKDIDVRAVNFSAYGASFVCVDARGNVIAPLYNYLKPYPENLKRQFYDMYGAETRIAKETASPFLGSLNSGMQLYRLKHERPGIFESVAFALHLPQFLSYILSDLPASEITSIGCHTALWDFQKSKYHAWVQKENIDKRFASILPSGSSIPITFPDHEIEVGIGLHDSSAALIPYLSAFKESFVLISTGTWCISLNPFNNLPLTKKDLVNDCLCYMSYEGTPVKASRLFAGHEHEQQVKVIADHFHQSVLKYRNMEFNPKIITELHKKDKHLNNENGNGIMLKKSLFEQRNMSSFATDEEAYHQLILDIVTQQYASTQLVLKGVPVKRIFVDGGFSKNFIYMNLLASFFTGKEIFAASMAQATAAGAALSIHKHWNKKPVPNDIIELKYYSFKLEEAL